MEIIKYKNLEWYVINETDKEKLLFLRDSFSDEQVLKYFTDKSMIDVDCAVEYSKLNSPWYIDSYIRKVLNVSFLNDLDKNDLNIMKTTLTLGTKTSITEDYVRLITTEEVETLQKTNMEVLNTEGKYGYWTMSPYTFRGCLANARFVYKSAYSSYLSYCHVNDGCAVRPVISLKPESLKPRVSLENDEIQKAILKFRKRTMH